jgi:O-antigen/teichoic acid export membrane protein
MIASLTTGLRRVLRTLRERLLSGFLWNLTSALALQGSMLLSSLIVARLLGLEDFGIYAVVVGTAMMVAGVAQGSVGLIGTKYVGELLHTDPARVARVLRMCAVATSCTGLLAGLVLLLMASVVAQDLLRKPQVQSYIPWAALAVIFQVKVGYQYGALQGFGAFRLISYAGMASGLLQLVASAAGAWLNGVGGALAAFALASAGRWLFFGWALRRTRLEHRLPAGGALRVEDWRLVWSFALPASLAGFVTLSCLWGVTVLVARQPDGLAWVALFSVGHQVRQVVLQAPLLLNAVSFSVLSRLKGQGESAEFRQVFWSNVTVGLALASALVVSLSLVAPQVLGLYGTDFKQGETLLVLLLVSAIPEVLAGTVYQLVQSSGRMWHSLTLITLPRDLGYFLMGGLLIAKQQLEGAGAAYLLAQILGVLMTVAVVRWTREPPAPRRH